MIRRYTPIRRYSLKPRRGAVEDRAYLRWLHGLGCIVQHPNCSRWTEAHHVGRPRNDRRAVPLCAKHHREGPEAVHVIGRRAFEARFGISFEAAIVGLNDEWETTKGRKIA
jgi:hypothetical protein